MENKINQSQLSDMLARESGLSKTASEQFVKAFFDTITDKVLEDGLVKVKGFGTFKLVQMEDRESVNVNTGERFTIEGHQKITFIPDASLKESVNSPFAAFETVEISEEQARELVSMDTQEDCSGDSESENGSGSADNGEAGTNGNAHEGQSDQSSSEKKPRGKVLLRVLAWITAIVLVIGILLYVLWPFIASGIAGLLEPSTGAGKSVKPSAQTETVVPRDTVAANQTDTVPTDTVAMTTVPTAQVTEPEQSQNKADNASLPTFRLLESDLNRDLSEYSAADTLNYRAEGVLTVHVMQQGETLTRLALKYYGTKKLWPYIAGYNESLDLNRILPGTEVVVPILHNR